MRISPNTNFEQLLQIFRHADLYTTYKLLEAETVLYNGSQRFLPVLEIADALTNLDVNPQTLITLLQRSDTGVIQRCLNLGSSPLLLDIVDAFTNNQLLEIAKESKQQQFTRFKEIHELAQTLRKIEKLDSPTIRQQLTEANRIRFYENEIPEALARKSNLIDDTRTKILRKGPIRKMRM